MDDLQAWPTTATKWTEATIVDRTEIDDVMFDYLDALDRHDVERFLSTFTHDAEITVDYRSEQQAYAGTDRLREFVEGRGGNAFHVTTDSTVRVEGDEARRWSRFLGFPSGGESGPVVNWIGRTIDDLVRTDAGWRIQRRQIWVAQGGGSPTAPTA